MQFVQQQAWHILGFLLRPVCRLFGVVIGYIFRFWMRWVWPVVRTVLLVVALLAGLVFEPFSDWYVYSEAVYHEARGEGVSGRAAVLDAMLNRSTHSLWPSSARGVIYYGLDPQRPEKCDFSYACDRIPNYPPLGPTFAEEWDLWIWVRIEVLLRLALNEIDLRWSMVRDSTFYKRVGHKSDYFDRMLAKGCMEKVATVGRHDFFEWRPNDGCPGST